MQHSPDTCELFPVNEALLHSETIPKFTFDQLHVASSNMHKIIDSYMQNWNAFLNIAEENQRNDLNRNFLAELNAQRNRMESILNTGKLVLRMKLLRKCQRILCAFKFKHIIRDKARVFFPI